MQLSDYGMSRERGFLSPYEIDEVFLPTRFDEVVSTAERLTDLLSTGRVRHWLDVLPTPEVESWVRKAPEEQVRTMMVHYSFLVQAYVWGEDQPPAHLPACLAKPIVAIADHLGQAPLLPYSGYVLDNWARIDKDGPISLDNIRMVQNFLGGSDENWFVMVHVAIEAEAGVLLDNAVKLVAAARREDAAECESLLIEMDLAWEQIYANFARMLERAGEVVGH